MLRDPRGYCDFWLWDGSREYEGALATIADSCFRAHVREVRGRDPRVTAGDRPGDFFQRRFLAYVRLFAKPVLQEADIGTVERSSTTDFEYFVTGSLRPIERELERAERRTSFSVT